MDERLEILRVSRYLLEIQGEGDELVNNKHTVFGLPLMGCDCGRRQPMKELIAQGTDLRIGSLFGIDRDPEHSMRKVLD
jgi:hypothetical protein